MSKLIDIQRDLKVLKSQFNKFGGYSFRSSEDILLALKPLLVKYEATLTISDKIHSMGENCIYIEAIATLECDEKIHLSSSFARDALQQKGMSASQCTNSASSFARKQALSGLFLLDDTATPILSKDEQEADEANIEQAKQEEAERLEAQEEERLNNITAFLDDVEKNIENTLSLTELQAIYKALYREARKFGQETANSVEKLYKAKKEIVK